MSEANQGQATKKKRRIVARLVVYSLLIGVALAFLFGMNSVEQWDLSTGQSRYVTTVIGIPVWYGEPRPTTVSEWLSKPEGERDWVQVRGPRIRKAKVSHCVHDLLWQFFQLEGDLESIGRKKDTQEGRLFRHQIAAAVLRELRTSQSICRVSRHFSAFRMQFIETYWHDQMALTPARLNETWELSGNFLDGRQNQPIPPGDRLQPK
jgi:hypothetical protein